MNEHNNDKFDPFERLLKKIGLKADAFYKIRFGGVVGKIALIACFGVIPAAILAASYYRIGYGNGWPVIEDSESCLLQTSPSIFSPKANAPKEAHYEGS